MPDCLMLSYHASIERLRAERMLDAAQAAAYPHLEKQARDSFLRENQRRRARALPAGTRVSQVVPAGGNAPFTVDGRPVDKDGLVRWLGQVFGGGDPFGRQAAPATRSTNGGAPPPRRNGHDTGRPAGRGPVVRDPVGPGQGRVR